MSAPNMRERVRFDLQSQTVDAAGNIATTWTAVGTVWAAVTRKAAKEAWIAGRAEGIRTFEFVARWRADIGTNHRLFWRWRRFDINSVENDDGQRQFMTILATERDADADAGAPGGVESVVDAGSSTNNGVITPDLFGNEFAIWFAALPTSDPGVPGQFWNNGGELAQSV